MMASVNYSNSLTFLDDFSLPILAIMNKRLSASYITHQYSQRISKSLKTYFRGMLRDLKYALEGRAENLSI